MHYLKNFLFIYAIIIYSQNGFADCKLCEKIREENAKKTNPYEYYEDYLEAKKNGEVPDDDIDFSTEEQDEASPSNP